MDNFRIRVAEILVEENINFDLDVLDSYVQTTYPDLRKCINTVQLNCENGSLSSPIGDEQSTADWQIAAVELFKAGKITEGRKLICSQIRPEEIEDFFKMCYRNLNWWSKTEQGQEIAIVQIRDAMVKHTMCADGEINLSAMLVELSRIDDK